MTKRPPRIPQAEPHEVTPQMRQRTQRTFFLILGAFLTGIMLMVAILAAQGRVNRTYGQEVYRAVTATRPSSNISYEQKCVDAVPKPLPPGVEGCQVKVEQGKVTITVMIEGGRQYLVDH